MGALVEALVRLVKELGGRFHFNSEVSEIIIGNHANGSRAANGARISNGNSAANGYRAANGIRLADGIVHHADHVIANADVAWTYMNLIPAQARGLRNSNFRWRKLTRYSMSLVVIYFGTKKLYRQESKLAHHNIILSERYQGLLADIFKHKKLPQDFSLYLHMPTLTDATVAPEGHEAFYVLAPVPHLGAGWIGHRQDGRIAMPSCSSWKHITCPICRLIL